MFKVIDSVFKNDEYIFISIIIYVTIPTLFIFSLTVNNLLFFSLVPLFHIYHCLYGIGYHRPLQNQNLHRIFFFYNISVNQKTITVNPDSCKFDNLLTNKNNKSDKDYVYPQFQIWLGKFVCPAILACPLFATLNPNFNTRHNPLRTPTRTLHNLR